MKEKIKIKTDAVKEIKKASRKIKIKSEIVIPSVKTSKRYNTVAPSELEDDMSLESK